MANRKKLVSGRFLFCISLVLIGFLALIAIPGYRTDRPNARRNACINNLRQIDGAKEQWALENKKNIGEFVTVSNVAPYIKNGWPTCPSGGTYTVGRIGENPTCSVPGHSL